MPRRQERRQYVDSAEIGAWLRCIGTNHERPKPPARRR
jgi:hypothetical protein